MCIYQGTLSRLQGLQSSKNELFDMFHQGLFKIKFQAKTNASQQLNGKTVEISFCPCPAVPSKVYFQRFFMVGKCNENISDFGINVYFPALIDSNLMQFWPGSLPKCLH